MLSPFVHVRRGYHWAHFMPYWPAEKADLRGFIIWRCAGLSGLRCCLIVASVDSSSRSDFAVRSDGWGGSARTQRLLLAGSSGERGMVTQRRVVKGQDGA